MKNLTSLFYFSSVIVMYPSLCIAQDWLAAKETLVVNLQSDVDPHAIRFILNNTDLSSAFKQRNNLTYIYQASNFPLPSGEHTLTVYQVLDGQWQEIQSQQVKVLTKSGFETANWSVNGSLSIDAQLDADYQGEAFKPDESRFRTGNAQWQVSSEHVRQNMEIRSQINIVGTTQQTNALQFSERGEEAQKIDLSEYLVTVKKGKVNVSVGHTTFGNNPLLLDNLSNRGIHIGFNVNSVFDVAFTQKNGSAIVGWQNIFGQQSSQHRISASTLGAEVFPDQPGKLRIQMSYLDGQVFAIDDFAVGQVSDMEKNQGWGLRVMSQLWDGRVRFDVVFASSQYTNPNDQALFLDDEFALVTVDKSTEQAYQVNVGMDLLIQNEENNRLFTASINLGQDKVDALYRVIAADPSADQKTNRVGLTGNLASAQWKYDFIETQNNVDRIPSILTSNTKSHTFNYSIDLTKILQTGSSETEPNPFLPSLNVNLQNVHQKAINAPVEELSDFNSDSHLPDQVTKIAELSANWSFSKLSLGYNLSYSEQDNRQIGRQLADFTRINHSVNQNIQLLDNLSFNLDIGRARNVDHEQNTVFYNNNASVMMNYSVSTQWQMSVGSSINKDYDNFNLSTQNAFTLNAALNYQWSFNLYTHDLSGQWYLRYAKQRNKSQDNVFLFNTFAQDWNITSGINVTF